MIILTFESGQTYCVSKNHMVFDYLFNKWAKVEKLKVGTVIGSISSKSVITSIVTKED